MNRLRVSSNGRYLVQDDGQPFFYLGDTAWELFHRLSREEAGEYLKCRARQGFTVIQAVALSEMDGLRVPNAHGRTPLNPDEKGNFDPTRPDLDGPYSYWDHLEAIVDLAAQCGLYIALLPTWGDKVNRKWGMGPEIFDPQNARAYGRWLGGRMKDKENILWILGGDRPMETRAHFETVYAMAQGLREGDGGGHLMSYHPSGGDSSSRQFHDAPWLDFNMIQSGHARNLRSDKMVLADYGRTPTKPVLDGEPCYEDHPNNFQEEEGFMDAADVRRALYYDLLSGACGHTYGNHAVWAMRSDPSQPGYLKSWRQALKAEGGSQMRHGLTALKALGWPDTWPDEGCVLENREGANHVPMLRGRHGALLYLPNGLPVKLKADEKWKRMGWFNPRSGEWSWEKMPERVNEGVFLVPPSAGRGQDWVALFKEE